MASENKNENVMLTGQSAYFKKNGSMTNLGKITVSDQDTYHVFGPGFIDEGSTLQPAILESSTEYENVLEDMQFYLVEDFIDTADDYIVKANAENIFNELEPKASKIESIMPKEKKYAKVVFLKADGNDKRLDVVIPLHLENDFILQINSDVLINEGVEYSLIESDTFRLWQNTNGEFYINNDKIPSLEHNYGLMTISQQDGKFIINIGEKQVFEHDAYFDYEIDITVNTQFTSQIGAIKLYNTNTIDTFISSRNTETNGYGMYNEITGSWYPTETPIRLYYEYEYANIWSGAIDLGYCPGPNTGIEVKYRQYSSVSGNDFRNIVGCYSGYSLANTMSFGILVGSGATVYATRNNNIVSWINSGVVSASGTPSVVTVNKFGDGKFKSTGTMTFEKTLPGSATIQNKGNATLWLAGGNDMGRYMHLDSIPSKDVIPMKSDIYIYYIKIYEGTTLVRDYVVGKDLNGTVGMWEKMQCKMYPKTKCSFSVSGAVIN